MQSPEIGPVSHWRPPDLQISDTDPSLVHTAFYCVFTMYTQYEMYFTHPT